MRIDTLIKHFTLLFLLSMSLAANEQELLKGVVLERISHFIRYPEKEDNSFVFCTYKDENLYDKLTLIYEKRKLHSSLIDVLKIDSLSSIDIRQCDVFYSKEGVDVHAKNFDTTLFVTENQEALEQGYMIALFFKNNRVNFIINHQAIVDTKLQVDYRLLKAASKVINRVKVD